MSTAAMEERARSLLHRLCVDVPSRRVGSEGNQAATDLFAQLMTTSGFATEAPGFACVDWCQDGADLVADGVAFDALPSPYSLGCQVEAPLVVASSLQDLESLALSDRILLMNGDLAVEPLMPKPFPFYDSQDHRRIIGLLESGGPRAIITACRQNTQSMGAVYPYPLLEDGDFDIPSVYLGEEQGAALAAFAGKPISLGSRARGIPSHGCNVIASKGHHPGRRVVVFAYVDGRIGTPGANDNASGVTALILLGELLAGYVGNLRVELVAMNGEDYYSNPGEQCTLPSMPTRSTRSSWGSTWMMSVHPRETCLIVPSMLCGSGRRDPGSVLHSPWVGRGGGLVPGRSWALRAEAPSSPGHHGRAAGGAHGRGHPPFGGYTRQGGSGQTGCGRQRAT